MRLIVTLTISLILILGSWTSEYQFHTDPHSYVLEKIRSHDITFLEKTHRRQPILNLISSLIPEFHKAEVTHMLLEIASDQQDKLDHFPQTGEGLPNIDLWLVLETNLQPDRNNIARTEIIMNLQDVQVREP